MEQFNGLQLEIVKNRRYTPIFYLYTLFFASNYFIFYFLVFGSQLSETSQQMKDKSDNFKV